MKRLYQVVKGGVIELPILVDQAGNYQNYPVTNSGVINPATIDPTSPVLYSSINNFQTMRNNCYPVYKGNNLPVGVGYAETPDGRIKTARLEMASSGSNRRPLIIGLDNTDVAAHTFVIGDGFGLFASKNAIAAKPAAVVVTGTYGANTLTRIADITKSAPFDLHGIHIVGQTTAGASSETFFLNGTITQFLIEPDMQFAKETMIPLSDEVSQAANKDNIRANEAYRFIVNGFGGYKITLPAGEKITITFRHLMGYGTAANMVLLGDGC